MSVFDFGTGLTHLVDALPAAILEELDGGPQTIESLAAQLSAWFGESPDAEWCTRVARSVNALALLQLVELAPAGA